MKSSSLSRLGKRAMSAAGHVMEKEFTVQAPWGNISVLTWGDVSNKPVLLLHGKMDSAAVFRPLVRMLPKDFYFIGVDFPGNGRSDHMPKGVPLSVLDFVPTVKAVVDHFRLDKFAYIGHSMGSHVGKYYHIAYPGKLSAMVDLDPAPAYQTHQVDSLAEWYHYFYGSYYSKDKYRKFNAPSNSSPVYTREKALERMMENRGISEEAATIALERLCKPAGEGSIRFTYDQRMKYVMRPPFSASYLQELYTSMEIPILCVLAQESLDNGWFSQVPFILDEKAYRKGNYRVLTVEGNHDVHLDHPERLAGVLAQFLIENAAMKAKL